MNQDEYHATGNVHGRVIPRVSEDRLTTAALFLDRDGVLNENRDDYVKTWQEFRWLPRALDAIAALSRLQVPIFVVTNQSMIGRGRATDTALACIHRRMLDQVAERGGRVDAILHCPHAPDLGCECRKPRPGLLFQVAQERGISLRRSVLIGDALTDCQLATAAGLQYVHVCSGLGRRDLQAVRSINPGVEVVADLADAVPVCAAILRRETRSAAPLNDRPAPAPPGLPAEA